MRHGLCGLSIYVTYGLNDRRKAYEQCAQPTPLFGYGTAHIAMQSSAYAYSISLVIGQ